MTQTTLEIRIFIEKNKQYFIYIKYYLHYLEASSFHIVENNLQALCLKKKKKIEITVIDQMWPVLDSRFEF